MAFQIMNISYTCDGKLNYLNASFPSNNEQYSATLTGLSKGEHTLTVVVGEGGSYYIEYSGTRLSHNKFLHRSKQSNSNVYGK